MTERNPKPIDLFRKLNLIDAMMNADTVELRAQHLGSRVILYRNLTEFGSVSIVGTDVFLAFHHDGGEPRRVTEKSASTIVELIEQQPDPRQSQKR